MTGADPLRSGKSSTRGPLFGLLPTLFGVLRAVRPILRLSKFVLVTRYDDVREVFENDVDFRVPYRAKLDVIMGGHPFFLGMDDTPQYRHDVAAMRRVVRPADIAARLAPEVEAAAAQIVQTTGGQVEVVDQLVRRVTFDVLARYFGVTDPPGGELVVWATRLFEFQFADPRNDPKLRDEVDRIAPALQAHIQSLIQARRASGVFVDDVLGRCLQEGFNDDFTRTALMGMVVGGPPQPPMVVPQAIEQLLRRPEALAGAQAAARAGNTAALAAHVFEAMRFDPLAPALPRVAVRDLVLAAGTPRATRIPEGAVVQASIASAMMDPRRLVEPDRFDPARGAHEYIHFGLGLHQCFGIHINRVILPLLVKPLLARDGLRRAPGQDGHLTKRGAFSERLVVQYS